MRWRSLVLVLLVVPIPVFAALYSGVRYGWWVASLPPGELSALLRPFDRVTRPEGDGPFPTALFFHGCGGVSRNMSDWAQLFREAGWASIVVDSLAGRGLDEETVCGGRALLGAERAGDVWVSLADARSLPFVDPDRIVLAGWSHGGWAIMDLLAMRAEGELPHNLSTAPDGGLEGVEGLMLLYPYCGIPARASVWRPPLPTLFLLAGADSVSDPAPCREVAGNLADRGDRVELVVFDGVDHAFDQPDLPAGSRLVYDPATTRAAMERARAFLARLAGPRAR